MRKRFRWTWQAALALMGTLAAAHAMSVPPAAPEEETPAYFGIATGSTAGAYFPIGSMIATIISHPKGSVRCELASACGPEGMIAVALASRGSVQNARDIGLGRVESGFVQANIAAWAHTGTEIFKGEKPYTDLRAIARLYPEAVHIVVARKAKVAALAGLKRKRVAIDVVGSGTHVTALDILRSAKLGAKSLSLQEVNTDRAAAMLRLGEIDGFFFVGGVPVDAISSLADDELIDLLPITEGTAAAAMSEEKFFRPAEIPAGAYKGLGPTETLAVGALWVVSAKAGDGLVYQITSALWDPTNRPFLERGHPQARAIAREAALDGVTIPLHPGAERYYREKGILPSVQKAPPAGSARDVALPESAAR